MKIAKGVFALRLRGALSLSVRPGQFLHVRIPRADLGLRRPISVCDVYPENKILTLIYRVEGAGTAELTKYLTSQDVDVLGPLGRGFPVTLEEFASFAGAPSQAEIASEVPFATAEASSEVLASSPFHFAGVRFEKEKLDTSNGVAFLIGGGIGVPPLLQLAKQLFARGVQVYAFLGFASADAVFGEQEFSTYAKVAISTDDGSYASKGNAMDLVRKAQAKGVKPQAVYACGPAPLLRAVDTQFKEHRYAYVSLEERMACGIGACYACVCHVAGDETGTLARKICDQGPVFSCGEVVI